MAGYVVTANAGSVCNADTKNKTNVPLADSMATTKMKRRSKIIYISNQFQASLNHLVELCYHQVAYYVLLSLSIRIMQLESRY